MSECIEKYYIHNSEIESTKNFNDEMITSGTSLYEVIRLVDGVPLFLDRHLDRLSKSAYLTNLNLWLDRTEIRNSIDTLVKENNLTMGNIKLVFNYFERHGEINRNYYAYVVEFHYPSDEQYEKGVGTILYHGERNNPNAKVISMEFRKNVEKKITEEKVYEAILVDRNGYITEGSKSNIFMVQGNNVITAPLGDVLPGITRGVIIEICKTLKLNIEEKRIKYDEIQGLDALFITGTSPKVLPIKKVDCVIFESSKNNVVLNIMRAYNEIINNFIKSYKNS